MLGITKWCLNRCVSWLWGKWHKRPHTAQAGGRLGKRERDVAGDGSSPVEEHGLGEHVRSRREQTSPVLSCGGIKCLPRSVSDSSLVNKVWNFLMMVVSVVGCTNNCEYLPLLVFWTFELVVYNLPASAHLQWPAVVPEFTVNMTMKDSVKHFQDKHLPFLPSYLRNRVKCSL